MKKAKIMIGRNKRETIYKKDIKKCIRKRLLTNTGLHFLFYPHEQAYSKDSKPGTVEPRTLTWSHGSTQWSTGGSHPRTEAVCRLEVADSHSFE
jgi:hypothetical protein